MEKKKIVITVLFICLFMIVNSAVYSQTAPFGYIVKGNPEFRTELEKKIENILESEGFNVKSVKITTGDEEKLDKTVVANISIGLLEKDAGKTGQYLANIKEAISKEIPDIDSYIISFTFEIPPPK